MAATDNRDFNTMAKTWDEDPLRVKFAHCVADAVLASVSVSAEMDAVDYGCGTGLVTLALQPYVKTIIGLDSSTGMLAVLESKIRDKELANVSTLEIDLENNAAADLHADLLVSSMTMHHVSDLHRVFTAFNQILKSGGYLAIADLDSDNWEFHADNTGVVHPGFDRSEFVRLLEKAGFVHAKVTTVMEFQKEVEGKGIRGFSIFLAVARKP